MVLEIIRFILTEKHVRTQSTSRKEYIPSLTVPRCFPTRTNSKLRKNHEIISIYILDDPMQLRLQSFLGEESFSFIYC